MRKRRVTSPPVTLDPSQVQLLAIPEVARLMSVGRTKVYALIKSRELEAVKIGSATRVPLVALQRWIETHKQVS